LRLAGFSKILDQQFQLIRAPRSKITPIFAVDVFNRSYKAANWIYLGDTTGRGKNDQSKKANRSIKAVFGYPLIKDFRRHLCGGRQ